MATAFGGLVVCYLVVNLFEDSWRQPLKVVGPIACGLVVCCFVVNLFEASWPQRCQAA